LAGSSKSLPLVFRKLLIILVLKSTFSSKPVFIISPEVSHSAGSSFTDFSSKSIIFKIFSKIIYFKFKIYFILTVNKYL